MEAAACLLLLLPHLAPLPAAKFWLLVVNRLGACLLPPASSLLPSWSCCIFALAIQGDVGMEAQFKPRICIQNMAQSAIWPAKGRCDNL